MVLNNKAQLFTFYFPSNFWYEEVEQKWTDYIKRMKLPYESVEDFMNQQVQQVTFPSMTMTTASQTREQYEVVYYGGKELEVEMQKELRVTFKLTESYLSYWIIFDQMDRFLHYTNGPENKHPCWMEPVKLGFLTDSGIQLIDFTFYEITPINTTELTLSYAATVASYNTFSWTLHYNRFEIS